MNSFNCRNWLCTEIELFNLFALKGDMKEMKRFLELLELRIVMWNRLHPNGVD